MFVLKKMAPKLFYLSFEHFEVSFIFVNKFRIEDSGGKDNMLIKQSTTHFERGAVKGGGSCKKERT